MAAVLLVEDEEVARRMLTVGLERLGHRVVACADGAEALALLDDRIDVVVTDLVMPKSDGLALLRTLEGRDDPPLRIVITSFADKDRAIEALNLGAHYLLEKPFLAGELDQVIQRVLRRGGGSVEDIFERQMATLPISSKERQLIVYVLKGLPNAEIAAQLGSSEVAVKSALFALYRKLGISSRGELFHLIFPI
jgi:DNA-binding NarL/FixJ family response regulator